MAISWAGLGVALLCLLHRTLPISGSGCSSVMNINDESVVTVDEFTDDQTCTFLFTAGPGNWSSVRIFNYSFETPGDNVTCKYDYLTVDGSKKVCGHNDGEITFYSTTTSMSIEFHTDESNHDGYFSLQQVFYAPACGGDVTTESTIDSVDFLGQPGYSNNMVCEWQITAPDQHAIGVKILFVDLEKCSGRDFLEISNTIGRVSDPLSLVICGQNGESEFELDGPNLFVYFESDESVTLTGFSIEITFIDVSTTTTQAATTTTEAATTTTEAATTTTAAATTTTAAATTTTAAATTTTASPDCGGTRTDDHGTIETPNYPHAYNNDDECTWTIQAPVAMRVHLTFESFDLEPENSCNYDFATVTDGVGGSDISGRLCGSSLDHSQANYQSTGRELELYFTSDDSKIHPGFRVTYFFFSTGQLPTTTTVLPQGTNCGGYITYDHGTLTSPNYPDDYPKNEDCYWYVQAPGNFIVEFTVHYIRLEQSPECDLDWVQVFEGFDGTDETAKLTERLCHPDLPNPPVIQTAGDAMLVYFHSDEGTADRGFRITYKFRPVAP